MANDKPFGFAIVDERGFNQVFRPSGTTLYRAQRRCAWFAEQAQTLPAKRILEIGCGLGDAAYHLARSTGAEVLGIDLSPSFVDAARSHFTAANLTYRVLDICSVEFDSLGHFDLVVGNGILHHLRPRLTEILARLRALILPNGGLAFIEPNLLHPACMLVFGTALGRRLAKLEPDEMAFRAGELSDALRAAGWCDIQVKTADLLLPGLPKFLTNPLLCLERLVEASFATRVFGQSHFVTGRNPGWPVIRDPPAPD
jgi:SAM-dependent methyltransferase